MPRVPGRRWLATLRGLRPALTTGRPPTPGEYAWAVREVFGPTLPPRTRLRLTPALGPGGRAFTLPWPGRRVLVGLGPDRYADPVGVDPGLFVHELTHAWQVAHARSRLGWLFAGVAVQLRHRRGEDVYDPGAGGRPWGAYTIEQQATIVARWTVGDAAARARWAAYVDQVRRTPVS